MADKDLFNGHKYVFTKVSSSLVLEDSTDNSHEKITFREGLVASESIKITADGGIGNGHAFEILKDGAGFSGGDEVFVIQGNGETEIRCSGVSFPLEIFNDGDNSFRYGPKIQGGTDTGTWYGAIMFYDGNGTSIGKISFSSGNMQFTYFTGVHEPRMLDADSISANTIPSSSNESYQLYNKGSIVSMVKSEISTLESGEEMLQPIEYCVTSSIHQDKRVFGVYIYSYSKSSEEVMIGNPNTDGHTIYAVGDGVILVNNQNGNIENGDYITTASGSGGYGCKQNDDILHNYTVAKSLTDVDWSAEPSSSKLIACTYHCG
jgi:hypothetical protein|tara:strand:+ start:1698 stop:2654 length:957 start_codon:yes stop_codon:yes gene_type:complete